MARKGAQSGAKDGPKCPKGAKKEPKSSLLSAKSVTLGRQIGESGPLLKHAQGPRFHHIMGVRALPFLGVYWTRERIAHRYCPFSHFWLHFGRQSDAQGRLKAGQGSPKSPKGLPKPPPGRLKITTKSTWDPTLEKRAAREAPGVPPGGKMTPKSMKKRLILMPKICKKRPAFRLVFQLFWV